MDATITPTSNHRIAIHRTDGFAIFPDGDQALDAIRASAPREEVILAVAIRRAQMVALNYARRHAPDLHQKFVDHFNRTGLPVANSLHVPRIK